MYYTCWGNHQLCYSTSLELSFLHRLRQPKWPEIVRKTEGKRERERVRVVAKERWKRRSLAEEKGVFGWRYGEKLRKSWWCECAATWEVQPLIKRILDRRKGCVVVSTQSSNASERRTPASDIATRDTLRGADDAPVSFDCRDTFCKKKLIFDWCLPTIRPMRNGRRHFTARFLSISPYRFSNALGCHSV